MTGRLSLLGLMCLVGCAGGASDDPDLGQVTGVVTVEGQPLANAVVRFTPQGEGRPSFGETDSTGRYSLLFKQDNPGAMVGTHVVRVEMVTPDNSEDEQEVSDAEGEGEGEGADADAVVTSLPAAATDGSLTFDVKPGDNQIDIPL